MNLKDLYLLFAMEIITHIETKGGGWFNRLNKHVIFKNN